jgi:hypothetical protein
MAGQASGDVLQQTVDGFAQKIQEYADGIAGRLGTPLSGQQLSKDDAVQRWNFTPLGDQQQADAQYHSLIAQGTPPGQALNQVYPMRQLLLQGSDLNESIAKAKQIQGWAADAAGVKPPEPFEGSTLHVALAQQGAQAPLPEPALPGPVAPPPLAGAAPPAGLPMPAPMPAAPMTTPALQPPTPMPVAPPLGVS